MRLKTHRKIGVAFIIPNQRKLPDVRQVVYFDAGTKKECTFITNHFKLSAQTVADIYKQRWQRRVVLQMDQAKPQDQIVN